MIRFESMTKALLPNTNLQLSIFNASTNQNNDEPLPLVTSLETTTLDLLKSNLVVKTFNKKINLYNSECRLVGAGSCYLRFRIFIKEEDISSIG